MNPRTPLILLVAGLVVTGLASALAATQLFNSTSTARSTNTVYTTVSGPSATTGTTVTNLEVDEAWTTTATITQAGTTITTTDTIWSTTAVQCPGSAPYC